MNLYAVPEKLKDLNVVTPHATIKVVDSDIFTSFDELPTFTLPVIDLQAQRTVELRLNVRTVRLHGARPTWMETTVELTKAFFKELTQRGFDVDHHSGNYPQLRSLSPKESWLANDLRNVLQFVATAGRGALHSVKDYRLASFQLNCFAMLEMYRKPTGWPVNAQPYIETAAKGKVSISNESGVFALYSPHFNFARGIDDRAKVEAAMYIEFVKHFPFLKGKVRLSLFDTYEDKTLEAMFQTRNIAPAHAPSA